MSRTTGNSSEEKASQWLPHSSLSLHPHEVPIEHVHVLLERYSSLLAKVPGEQGVRQYLKLIFNKFYPVRSSSLKLLNCSEYAHIEVHKNSSGNKTCIFHVPHTAINGGKIIFEKDSPSVLSMAI